MTNLYVIITGEDVFSSLGKHKILCADGAGYTVAFDIKSHTMPKMNTPKGHMRMVVSTIPRTEGHALSSDSDLETEAGIRSVSSGDHTESIYIMDMSPENPVPFEVLTFSTSRGWVWRPLPCPQFFDGPKYEPRSWDSCTVVDGTRIYFSPTTTHEDARLIGTYCFDTVTQEWKKADDWVLPFLGKAEFLPEFGLWLGRSSHSPHHCAPSALLTLQGWRAPFFLILLPHKSTSRFYSIKSFSTWAPADYALSRFLKLTTTKRLGLLLS
jgi:hypothetical protein